MMPLPLRILAIILAVLFFIYTIRLIRKNLAEVRHMLKWFILALVILFGAIFSEFAAESIPPLKGLTGENPYC